MDCASTRTARLRFAVSAAVARFGLCPVDLTEGQAVRGPPGGVARTDRAELLHLQVILGPRRTRVGSSQTAGARQSARDMVSICQSSL